MAHVSIGRRASAFRVRLGALSLVGSGLLFVLYPALRPFSDETTLRGAEAFASQAWVLAHTLGMLGFVLLVLGLSGLHIFLEASHVEPLALKALVLSFIGAGLTLPFYGAEAFGLHALGREAIRQDNTALVLLANDVRLGPGLAMIVAGLLILAVGATMAASAIWRSGVLARWSGVPLALAFALYLPQYSTPQPVRVAHGLLVAAGCLWIAASLWQQSARSLALIEAPNSAPSRSATSA